MLKLTYEDAVAKLMTAVMHHYLFMCHPMARDGNGGGQSSRLKEHHGQSLSQQAVRNYIGGFDGCF